MDRIGGWEEGDEQENWVGARFVSSIWIYTKAVVCNGHSHMQNFIINKLRSILEAVSWVCDDACDDHVLVSEMTIARQKAKVLEAFQYDIEIPCVVQWVILWFSAPASLNNDLLNDGEILEKIRETISRAFQSVPGVPCFSDAYAKDLFPKRQ